jgi:hypothetical protein
MTVMREIRLHKKKQKSFENVIAGTCRAPVWAGD